MKWSLIGRAMVGEHPNDGQCGLREIFEPEVDMKKPKRTKQEMARDVAYVLDSSSPLHDVTKRRVLNNVLWAWTTFHGKYKGCRHWTPAAIEHFAQRGKKKGLRHEHAVPRKLLIDMTVGMGSPQKDEVLDLFVRLAFGVVVTNDEQKRLDSKYKSKMPPEFEDAQSEDYPDPLLRFKVCGVEVVKHSEGGTQL
jgi:hypothetical protein